MGWQSELGKGKRYRKLQNWERTHNAERLHIYEVKSHVNSSWEIPLLIVFLAFMFFMLYVLTMNILSHFIQIDSELVTEDPSGGIFTMLFWFIIFSWLYSGLSGIWEEFAISGFYIDSAEFIKVLAYPFYTKIQKRPLSRVVTIEVVKGSESNRHILKVIFCAFNRKEYSWMTVFKFSTSVIQERYNYFPEEHGLKRRFIWGEYIDSDLNTTQEHLHEIALKGKQLLAKMTGNRIEFYYPELHCRNCQTLNQFEASICEACNQEINRITPNALALD